MASKAIAVKDKAPALSPDVMIDVLVKGEIHKLTDQQKLDYLLVLCKRYGLDPASRPFDFMKTTEGKLILYAKRDATDQLRKTNKISIVPELTVRTTDLEGGVVWVRVVATWGDRTDEAIGAVSILKWVKKEDCDQGVKPHFAPERGTALANAMMKAETKAKRRVTLSICGLGMLDETELETVPTVDQRPVTAEPYATPSQLGELERIEQADPTEFNKLLVKYKVISADMLSESQAAEIIREGV